MIEEILRMRDVIRVTRLSRATLYRYIAKGIFPKPLVLGNVTSKRSAIGWRASDIDTWMKTRTERAEKE